MKKLLHKVSKYFTSQDKLYQQLLEANVEIVRLKRQAEYAKRDVDYYRSFLERRRGPISLDRIDENAPQDTDMYEQYVADIANFHENIMSNKLKGLIGQVRASLASLDHEGSPYGVPRDSYDWYLRGTENALWLLYDWGELKSGERKLLNSNE